MAKSSAKPHRLTNGQVSNKLKEVMAAMEVKNAGIFRIRAYQNAIISIDNLTMSVFDLWEKDRLHEISGVGASLAQHLDELFRTGKVKEFIQVKKSLPEGMFSLIGLRGIGAKRAFKLAKAFNLDNRETAVELLRDVANTGKIRDLEGFGEKSEADILEAISEAKKHKSEKKRLLLVDAETIAFRVINHLEKLDSVKKAEAMGSLRRREATVGDIDIAASTKNSKEVVEHFLKFDEVDEVINKGDKKATVVLKNDIQVDLRITEPGAYGSMLQYFTGSKQHNIELRTYALAKGMSLSEYGIKKGKILYEFDNEADFYKKIELQYIPTEVRQAKNEIELAEKGGLPKLVSLADIKGDIHTHTDFSDGVHTLKQMAKAALKHDYEYYGVSDHAPSVVSRGKGNVKDIIRTQREYIEQINDSQDKTHFLLGYEVNILADAEVSLPDECLKMLDYAIGAIHSSFDQPRVQITKRLLAAIENPFIKVIGHPLGRLINERKGCDVDWEIVFEAVLKHNKILEINAQPNRLDLPDDMVYDAVKRGINLVIGTDAHSMESLDLMRYGIDVARRGWCTKENIINTLPLKKFLKVLELG